MAEEQLLWTPRGPPFSPLLHCFPWPLTSVLLPGLLTRRPERFRTISWCWLRGRVCQTPPVILDCLFMDESEAWPCRSLFSPASVKPPLLMQQRPLHAPLPHNVTLLELVPVFTSWLLCQVPSSPQPSQAGSAKDSAYCGFLSGIPNRLGGRVVIPSAISAATAGAG